MDLWTDLSSGTEWGLDLLDQPNALFGDLKDVRHLKGDIDPACKPGNAVGQMARSPESDGPLDFEWMESGDLGSFLDALDCGQDRLSSQDNLFDCSQEIINDLCAGQTKFYSNVASGQTFNQGLTPPESPEQVAPIIKLDPEINDNVWILQGEDIQITVPSQNYSVSLEECVSISESVPIVIQTPPSDLLDDHVDLNPELLGVPEILALSASDSDTGPELAGTSDFGSNFSDSSDDGSNSALSSVCPSPKPSVDIASLIQSSPELYKVIATPSSRFSPYSKSKGDHKSKGASRAKPKVDEQLPEIIPEELFPSNLGKKERKKLQNKNAAIRYRQKKKVEVEVIASEVQDLEDRNDELKTKVDDLQREVRYMKSLMEDIYRAKGLVN